ALSLVWRDETTLTVSPWPFDKAEQSYNLYHRELRERADTPEALRTHWDAAEPSRRRLDLTSADR
ncbi:MAG: hypothetical protein ABEN55_17765, partial [Bradymonadaceae bacterium]